MRPPPPDHALDARRPRGHDGRGGPRDRARPRLRDPLRGHGASRDRTGDLLLAKQALSQLSYGPVGAECSGGPAGGGGGGGSKRARPPRPRGRGPPGPPGPPPPPTKSAEKNRVTPLVSEPSPQNQP